MGWTEYVPLKCGYPYTRLPKKTIIWIFTTIQPSSFLHLSVVFYQKQCFQNIFSKLAEGGKKWCSVNTNVTYYTSVLCSDFSQHKIFVWNFLFCCHTIWRLANTSIISYWLATFMPFVLRSYHWLLSAGTQSLLYTIVWWTHVKSLFGQRPYTWNRSHVGVEPCGYIFVSSG